MKFVVNSEALFQEYVIHYNGTGEEICVERPQKWNTKRKKKSRRGSHGIETFVFEDMKWCNLRLSLRGISANGKRNRLARGEQNIV